jgi:hypothetical protein
VTIKQETTDWAKQNGQTLANMHLAQGHLDEQIQVEGELTQQEREQAILDSASSKEEIKTFKKELPVLKNQKQDMSRLNSAAKAEVGQVEKNVGRCNEPIWRGIKSILSKDWNIKRPSWHGGDILGNECWKLMSSAKLVLEQIEEFSLERLKENRDNSQWTGMNKLPSPEEITRLDETNGSDNDATDWIRQQHHAPE